MVLSVIRGPRRLALAAALLGLVTACGGGGGKEAGSPAPIVATGFALGGTVSGLDEGAVLTLAAGGETLQVARNGSFAFAGRRENGAAYSVSAAAPAGHSCKVGAGTGTVAGADVATIAVTCAPLLLAGARSLLQMPLSIALDSGGNQYVLDGGTQSLLKIAPSGASTVLAGRSGRPGYVDGAADSARFHVAGGASLVADGQGNLFVADNCNGVIRKVSADGVVSTLAGRQTRVCGGVAPGLLPQIDGSGKDAAFDRIGPMVPDGAGGVIAVEMNSPGTVRRVSAAGVVTTQTWPRSDFNDGSLYAEQIARGPDGTLYFAHGQQIWKTRNGELVFVAGAPWGGASIDGSGAAARFVRIAGLSVDADGNLYVADNLTVRKVTPAGVVTTLAGNNDVSGTADGRGLDASFGQVGAIAFDGHDLVAVDVDQKTLRRVTRDGVVTTSVATPRTRGLQDGSGSAVRMGGAGSLSADTAGNVYFVDYFQDVLRKATPDGVVSTIAGIAGMRGTRDGPAASALLTAPSHVAAGRDGAVWIAQFAGLRRLDNGSVSTVNAAFPARDIVVDADGNAIVSTYFPTDAVYKVTPAGVVTPLVDQKMVTSLLKNTGAYFSPQALAIDANGNLLIADGAAAVVYKLGKNGELSVFAGTPLQEGHADGPVGTGTLGFSYAPDMAVDDKDNVYLSGQGSVRVISPSGVLSSPDVGWGTAPIYALAYANGKLYGATNYALLQTYLP